MATPGFAVAPVSPGGLDGVLLSAPDGVQAVVALEGATLLSWRARAGGRLTDLVDGYRDAAELHGQDGVRNGVMVPYVNRIADARYTFDGRRHDLLPGLPEGRRTVYHGFLRRLRTSPTAAATTGSSACVELTTSIRPDTADGYPFELEIRVRYVLTATSLALEITGRNTSAEPVPYAVGWHPYFTLGDGPVDELELSVPAACVVRTRDLVPLDGPAAFDLVTARPDLDFRLPRRIAWRRLDVAFADLAPDDDGWATTVLRDPVTRAQLRIRQPGGLMHVFTGDTLARGRRRSVALEPVEVMTNAFNRRDCRSAITLAPGRSRTFRCLVEAR
jgi:aldose 1-epimerase